MCVGVILCTDFLIGNSNITEVYKRANYPYRAVAFIKENHYRGRLYNSYHYGGYLIWALPEEKVFIDGRMTSWAIEEERILKIYDEIEDFKVADWHDRLDNYDVNLMLLDKKSPMAQVLREVPKWRLVFEDDRSVVYVRTTKL
jgi:hypothetical protein